MSFGGKKGCEHRWKWIGRDRSLDEFTVKTNDSEDKVTGILALRSFLTNLGGRFFTVRRKLGPMVRAYRCTECGILDR